MQPFFYYIAVQLILREPPMFHFVREALSSNITIKALKEYFEKLILRPLYYVYHDSNNTTIFNSSQYPRRMLL